MERREARGNIGERGGGGGDAAVSSASRSERRATSTAAVLGALIRRDLMRSLRRVRPFVFLVVAMCALSLIILAEWPEPSQTLSRIARTSRELVMLFGFFCIAVAGLFLPAYGSMSVVLEREQDTLDLLSTTLIPPWGLLFSKLVNTIGLYVLFVIACAPVLGLVFCLVGLDLIVLGQTLLVVVMAALSTATLSVMCSIRARRSTHALIRAYLVMLFVMGAHMIPVVIIKEVFRVQMMSWTHIEELASIMSPFVCLATAVEGGWTFPGGFVLALAYQLTLAVLAFLVSWRLIRRPWSPKSAQSPWIRRRTSPSRRRTARVLDFLLGPPSRFRPIGDGENPVFRAETRTSLLGRHSGRRVLFVTLLLVELGWAALVGYQVLRYRARRDDMLMVWCFSQVMLVCAIAPATAGNMLTKERDLGNLDMLRMTLLRPRDIVLGKIGAALRGLRPLLTAAAIGSFALVPIAAESSNGFRVLATGFAAAGLCGLAAVCLSMLASMMAKHSVTAVVLSYAMAGAFIFFLYPGWEIGMEVFRNISRSMGYNFSFRHNGPIAKGLIWFSPAFSFVEQWEGRGRPTSFYWQSSVVTNLVVCGLVTAATVKGFARRYMREK